jgi:hypothetical protein
MGQPNHDPLNSWGYAPSEVETLLTNSDADTDTDANDTPPAYLDGDDAA